MNDNSKNIMLYYEKFLNKIFYLFIYLFNNKPKIFFNLLFLINLNHK